jgi:MFS family permease
MIGKFFIAGSFAIVFNYTAELFPTVVRNTAIGIGSMGARLSGALTPLITLLVCLSTNYYEVTSELVLFHKFCLLCFVIYRQTDRDFHSGASLDCGIPKHWNIIAKLYSATTQKTKNLKSVNSKGSTCNNSNNVLMSK